MIAPSPFYLSNRSMCEEVSRPLQHQLWCLLDDEVSALRRQLDRQQLRQRLSPAQQARRDKDVTGAVEDQRGHAQPGGAIAPQDQWNEFTQQKRTVELDGGARASGLL